MEIEFDPEKEATNLAKHKISLARAANIELVTYTVIERQGERRLKAMGFIDGILYAYIAIFRRNAVRAISLRRAHVKELEND